MVYIVLSMNSCLPAVAKFIGRDCMRPYSVLENQANGSYETLSTLAHTLCLILGITECLQLALPAIGQSHR